MIDIAFLADHPETIPTLAGWFRAQWPDYYAGRTSAEVAQDFYAEAQHNRLPVRLVAFADGAPAGAICLRQQPPTICRTTDPVSAVCTSSRSSVAGASARRWSQPAWTWHACGATRPFTP